MDYFFLRRGIRRAEGEDFRVGGSTWHTWHQTGTLSNRRLIPFWSFSFLSLAES